MFIKKKQKGFTIIEVLISLFIIVIGVIGSSIVIQDIFVNTFTASHKLTAAYLAKEGLEIVRNIRDTNWLKGENYDIGLVQSSPPSFHGCDPAISRYCEADLRDTSLNSINASSHPNPTFLKLSNHFEYSSFGNQTIFTRKIEIVKVLATVIEPEFLKVKVIVGWQERNEDKEIIIEGNLYDWK